MKRLLGSVLAAALLLPSSAHAAELLKNLQISGELDVDANSAANVTDFSTKHYDGVSSVLSLLMLHGDWDVSDDVHARVSVDKNNRTWGSASENLNGVESALFVDEAFVKIKRLFGAVDATVGRQYYGDPGDAVIYFGPHDGLYGLPITSLDAARFDYSGAVDVTLLAAKQRAIGLAPSDSGDIDIYGVKVSGKAGENLSGSVYLWDSPLINSQSVAGGRVLPDDIIYVAGLRGKATLGGAWVKAEFDQNFGQYRPLAAGLLQSGAQRNYDGWAFLADAGAKQDLSAGALQEFLSLGVGSGGNDPSKVFQPIASDYRPGDIWGRFFVPNGGGVAQGAGTLGGSALQAPATGSVGGLDVLGLGVKVTPAALSRLTAGVSTYRYRWQNADSANTYSPAANANTFIGEEYDLDLSWRQNENLTVTAGVGDFQPGNWVKAVTSATGSSPTRLAYADLKLKFGGSN